MTAELAQELIAWLDNARFYTLYRAPGQQGGGVKVTLLPDALSPQLWALLASGLVAKDWHVTPDGLGIEGMALRYLDERAKRVAPVATAEPTPKAAAAALTRKVRPAIETMWVPQKNVPAGFVTWQVVDPAQTARCCGRSPTPRTRASTSRNPCATAWNTR